MGNPTFSVLICTYQRDDMLQVALKALVDGTTEKPDEIVIVNGGDQRADAVVQSFADRSPIDIRIVKTVNQNLATSRNIGLKACRGDIIAMTDDDAEVFPDWVTQMKRIHAEYPDVGAVGGAILGARQRRPVHQPPRGHRDLPVAHHADRSSQPARRERVL